MDITYKNYHEVNQTNKSTIYFRIFHQNIRGLGMKACELLSRLHPDFLYILCLTEHHLKYSHFINVILKITN